MRFNIRVGFYIANTYVRVFYNYTIHRHIKEMFYANYYMFLMTERERKEQREKRYSPFPRNITKYCKNRDEMSAQHSNNGCTRWLWGVVSALWHSRADQQRLNEKADQQRLNKKAYLNKSSAGNAIPWR